MFAGMPGASATNVINEVYEKSLECFIGLPFSNIGIAAIMFISLVFQF